MLENLYAFSISVIKNPIPSTPNRDVIAVHPITIFGILLKVQLNS